MSLPHTSPKVLSAADLKQYRESGSRIAQTEQFQRLIATIDALTAERDHIKRVWIASVNTAEKFEGDQEARITALTAERDAQEKVVEAARVLVACEGGQWHGERYDLQRRHALEDTFIALTDLDKMRKQR